MVNIYGTPKLMKEDKVNDIKYYDAHVDPSDIRGPRLDPPGKLLLAAVGVLVAGDQVSALDGHWLPVVDEILNAIGTATAHLNLFKISCNLVVFCYVE